MESKAYEKITERVCGLIESGVVPWRRPWSDATRPRSIHGRLYTGCNRLLLSSAGFESPFFVTFPEVKRREGFVRKGEAGWPVVFFKSYTFTKKAESGLEEEVRVPLARFFYVWNLSQCEFPQGPGPLPALPVPSVLDAIEAAEAIVAAMPSPPSIHRGSDAAYYRPLTDEICVPALSQYQAAGEFYATLFHELTHSTGHKSRLARPGVCESQGLGSESYSEEELIAEMGACFLSGEAGILAETENNSAAYLAAWVARLRSDKKLLVRAAAAAEKAANFILGRKPAEESESVSECESMAA